MCKRIGCKRNIKMHKLILKETHFERNPSVETRKALEECKMGLGRCNDKKTEGIIVRFERKTKPHEKTY